MTRVARWARETRGEEEQQTALHEAAKGHGVQGCLHTMAPVAERGPFLVRAHGKHQAGGLAQVSTAEEEGRIVTTRLQVHLGMQRTMQ